MRILPRDIRALGVEQGDLVRVKGKRVTAAIVIPCPQEHRDRDVIHIDGLTRRNARVAIGETVEVSSVEWAEAHKVVLSPAKPGLVISGPGEALRSTLLYRPLVEGDLVSTSILKRPGAEGGQEGFGEEFFRTFFGTHAYGLMEIRLVVSATEPKGIVRVTEGTEIELVPEHRAPGAAERIAVTYDDLGGLRQEVHKIREIVELPLKHPELFDRMGIDPPRGVLLHGPPGTGKTLLARAVAHESEAAFLVINGPEIMGKMQGESEERLRRVFEEAEKSAPAIIFLDELDSIAPKRSEVASESERRIVSQLLTLMDGLKTRRHVIVLGATNRVEAIDPALRRPGRFDREIVLGIPDRQGRREILQIHTRGMPLGKDVDLDKISEVTHGFTGSDIAALAKEAALATLRRILPTLNLEEGTVPGEVLERLYVRKADVDEALKEVQPSALREIMIEVPNVHWDQVGGLHEVKEVLHERVEMPLRDPESFTRIGIRPPKGILLYGPPGTGKTLIAKAVATEASANFITAKGSALLSKWYGESEKKIAEIFHRARQVTPSILFFDELDALAPVRGGSLGEPQVTERVVNQFLAEMDGMVELRGVVVLGATNRPDMIDPALLRPGRFDELVMVPVPDRQAREEIFAAHAKGMALAPDVDFGELAKMTDKFTGADIAGVCVKAGLLALREDRKARHVTMAQFLAAVGETVPSVTTEMIREYEKLAFKVKQQVARIGFK